MSDAYFLDLNDAPRVVDFLVDAAAYADAKERAAADDRARRYHDGETLDKSEIAGAAIKLGWSTWPARTAVVEVLNGERSDKEWSSVIAAIRPSTAHLLQRFKKASETNTLEELLSHEEVETALREEERMEVNEIRKHVREDFWKTDGANIKDIVEKRQDICDEYKKRFGELRELAVSFPPVMQDEVYSKIQHFEDRILFAAETVPMEILEKEIQYYTEQKEISPLEQG